MSYLFSIESIPMGGVKGAIWIQNRDAVNREKNISCRSNRKVRSKGSLGGLFDLRRGIAAVEPLNMFGAFGHERVCNEGGRSDIYEGVMEMDAVVISMLDDKLFLASSHRRCHRCLYGCFYRQPLLRDS